MHFLIDKGHSVMRSISKAHTKPVARDMEAITLLNKCGKYYNNDQCVNYGGPEGTKIFAMCDVPSGSP